MRRKNNEGRKVIRYTTWALACADCGVHIPYRLRAVFWTVEDEEKKITSKGKA
jgi:hypothetical protein